MTPAGSAIRNSFVIAAYPPLHGSHTSGPRLATLDDMMTLVRRRGGSVSLIRSLYRGLRAEAGGCAFHILAEGVQNGGVMNRGARNED